MEKSWYKLSWFKKIFQKIKIAEDDEQQYRENKQPEWESREENYHETAKDMNAKVVYQYPKGQFRFPLIPDDISEPNSRDEKMQREKRHERMTHESEKKQVERERTNHLRGDRSDTTRMNHSRVERADTT